MGRAHFSRRLTAGELAACDPLRPPNFRSQRVMQMLTAKPQQRPTVYDDQPTVEAYRFMKRLENSLVQTTGLFSEQPILWCAYRLYSEGDSLTRANIEARLLAGQSNEEIADCYGTYPETIGYYEALYFAVRDRLKQRDWILRVIYGPDAENLKHDEQGVMLRLFSYHGGPKLLEMMLSGFNPEHNIEGGSLDDYLDKHTSSTLRRRVATSLMHSEINRFNLIELVGAHQRLVELTSDTRSQSAAGGMQNPVRDNIVGLLQQISWLVGSGKDTKATMAKTPAGKFIQSPVQLRADDELALAFGEISPETVVDLEQQRLPPPRTVQDENTQPAE